jgi:hypothetical protein
VLLHGSSQRFAVSLALPSGLCRSDSEWGHPIGDLAMQRCRG